MTRQYYIFDIDGTIANVDHRVHLLGNPEDRDRWDKFYDLCSEDPPILAVTHTLNALAYTADIHFWTARSERVRMKTVMWLVNVTTLLRSEVEPLLKMRPIGNYMKDLDLKAKWLSELSSDYHPIGVFEDRQRVVDMWRKKGIQCYQTTTGDF